MVDDSGTVIYEGQWKRDTVPGSDLGALYKKTPPIII